MSNCNFKRVELSILAKLNLSRKGIKSMEKDRLTSLMDLFIVESLSMEG